MSISSITNNSFASSVQRRKAAVQQTTKLPQREVPQRPIRHEGFRDEFRTGYVVIENPPQKQSGFFELLAEVVRAALGIGAQPLSYYEA